MNSDNSMLSDAPTKIITNPLITTPTHSTKKKYHRFLKHKKQNVEYPEYPEYIREMTGELIKQIRESQSCKQVPQVYEQQNEYIPQNLDSALVLLKEAGYEPNSVMREHNRAKNIGTVNLREYFTSEESCIDMCNKYSKYITITNVLLLIILVFLINNLRN